MKDEIQLDSHRDEFFRGTVYRLFVPDAAIVHVEFDRVDQLLMKECDSSEKVSDKLLALELLVRKSGS